MKTLKPLFFVFSAFLSFLASSGAQADPCKIAESAYPFLAIGAVENSSLTDSARTQVFNQSKDAIPQSLDYDFTLYVNQVNAVGMPIEFLFKNNRDSNDLTCINAQNFFDHGYQMTKTIPTLGEVAVIDMRCPNCSFNSATQTYEVTVLRKAVALLKIKKYSTFSVVGIAPQQPTEKYSLQKNAKNLAAIVLLVERKGLLRGGITQARFYEAVGSLMDVQKSQTRELELLQF